jgi:two-component system sensor histidine kinase UhpB
VVTTTMTDATSLRRRGRGSGRSVASRFRRAAARVRPEPGYRRLSLYARVLFVNAGVLVVATAALVFTPATVSFPLGVEEAVVLLIGLAAMVVANAALLRVSFAPLARLVRVMRTIDLLRPGQRIQVSGGVEVRQVIGTFNEMLERLERERQASAHRVLSAQEAERRRIGRELHDEIGQRLTGILLHLQRTVAGAPAGMRAELVEAQELARSTLDEVGRLAWQLRPGILDDLGLERALEALAETLEERAPVRVDAHLEMGCAIPDPEAELAVYRIAQESLTNVARHARAARVELELLGDERVLSLSIVDDGCGLSDLATEGSGIRGMRERAVALGAELAIGSSAQGGVAVQLSIPLSRARG